MTVKILNAQYLMTIYNIHDYSNIYKVHRIKVTREFIQYELILCTLGPDNANFLMRMLL